MLAGNVKSAVRQHKLDVGVVELLNSRTASLGGGDGVHFHDLNGLSASAMTAGHIIKHLGHGSGARGVAKLLVHVVGTRTRVVAQKNAKVLHNLRKLSRSMKHAF